MKKVLLKSILCIMNVILAKPALAQSHQLIGSWRLIAADYGSAPHGITIFTTDGHYVVEIFGTERMKFATTERGKGTPEEYKTAVLNQSCHFGTYSMDSIKGTITFNIDRGTYPNQDQTLQVRPFTLKGDTLSWRVPARPDGSIPVSVFTRIRTQVPLHHQGVQGVMY